MWMMVVVKNGKVGGAGGHGFDGGKVVILGMLPTATATTTVNRGAAAPSADSNLAE